jgi:selenide,water dikinase
MGIGPLAQVLRGIPVQSDNNLLVGFDTSDDAAVYKISRELAIVTTLDFFPPIVDDPALFGEIAAANALSDVYAMGAQPKLAMNIVCFPTELGTDVLSGIINGAIKKLGEAGALLVGGHSIEDKEVKFGLSITGFVDPLKVITNAGARAGDVLILTKPLGTGVIASAVKKEKIKPEEAEEAFNSMRTLSNVASSAMREIGVSACTDVTGYGLAGHAMEMAKASRVSIKLNSKEVPCFKEALRLVALEANRPRTLEETRKYLLPDIQVLPSADQSVVSLMYDPQTSGGLLISVSKEKSGMLVNKLNEGGVKHAVIGEVVEKNNGWTILIC